MKTSRLAAITVLGAMCVLGGTGRQFISVDARTVRSQEEILKEATEKREQASKSEAVETTWEKEGKKDSYLTTSTQAKDLNDLTEEERVQRIGEMCRLNYKETGLLASVSTAQCILESGFLSTDLAQSANNCFGMKCELSGNTWENSTWDNKSKYTKNTNEEYDGEVVTITADFRKYSCIEESIGDHAAYLLNAKNGDSLRYAGLNTVKDPREAITIIKNGGYATDSSYIDKVCSIIERYDLTQYDDLSKIPEETASKQSKQTKQSKESAADAKRKKIAEADAATGMKYFVRKSYEDKPSQLGAFIYLDNAKRACKDGYTVYDKDGNEIYTK